MDFKVTLPDWAIAETDGLDDAIIDVEERMRAVIRFSRLNVEHQTGGPFAAGIFEQQSGKVIAIGVNRVVPACMSSAHAEIVAISIAQQKLGTYDLGGPGMPDHQLVVTGRPCAMCFGSIPWSGVRSVVIAASGQQIEELTGFDEGPIHPSWQAELRARQIEVTEDLLQDEACEVLRQFAASDQPVYNGRSAK